MADEPRDPLDQVESPTRESATEEAISADVLEEPAPKQVDTEEAVVPPEESPTTQPGMNWYVLRVASNKEEQVRKALDRKVKIESLEDRIGRILVPTLKEKRMKGGQAKIYERKLYPGYVFVEMRTEEDGAIAENVWFLIKETTGVGDFIGSGGKPTKMSEQDVLGMLAASEKAEDQPALSGLNFKKDDPVKVTEGSFENFEGTIDTVDEHRGMVTVLLTIFGRSTPVEVEYWQLENL